MERQISFSHNQLTAESPQLMHVQNLKKIRVLTSRVKLAVSELSQWKDRDILFFDNKLTTKYEICNYTKKYKW